jgi:hypothetical protein
MQVTSFGAILLLSLLGGGGIGLPLGMPPLPPDRALMCSAPDDCLYYMSWAGTATPDPKSKNQTEQFLAEPEVQQFIQEVERQLLDALKRNPPPDPGGRMAATTLPPLLKTLLMRPGALYVSRVSVNFPNPPDIQGALVVNVGNEAQAVRRGVEQMEQPLLAELANFGGATELNVGEVKLKRWPMPPGMFEVAWGFKGDYFLFTVGGTAKEIVERLDPQGDLPEWLRQLHERLPVERPSMVTHINASRIYQIAAPFINDPHVPAVLEALGLSKVKSVSNVTGLNETGTVSKTLLAIDGEPSGLLASLAGEPLTAKELAAVPGDANIASVARLDLADVYRRVLDGLNQVEPQLQNQLATQVGQIEKQLGISLERDVLGALGNTWAIYNSPSQGGPWLTGTGASASLRNRDRFLAAHDSILQGIRAQLESQGNPPVAIKEFSYLDHDIYYLQSLRDPLPIAPAWCVTEDRVLVALFPQMIKAMLGRSADSKSLADNPAVAEYLPSGPIMLGYQNADEILPTLYSVIQALAPAAVTELNKQGVPVELSVLPAFPAIGRHAGSSVSLVRRTKDGLVGERYSTVPGADLVGAVPVIIAVGLPAICASHIADSRTQSMNNLKQIAIAMHNYHDAKNTLPASASYDGDGKPLLSWRVHILPYLNQNQLYKQFHLDEPWDSEHNSKLIAKMPPVYASPDHPELSAEWKTQYVVPTSKGTVFEGKEGKTVREITDGTVKTVMAVEAHGNRAVIWTKPDDFAVDLEQPLKDLAGVRGDGFLAVLVDGSVQTISNAINPKKMRGMFTYARREVFYFEQSPSGVY